MPALKYSGVTVIAAYFLMPVDEPKRLADGNECGAANAVTLARRRPCLRAFLVRKPS